MANPYHDQEGRFTTGGGGGIDSATGLTRPNLTDAQARSMSLYGGDEAEIVNDYLRGTADASLPGMEGITGKIIAGRGDAQMQQQVGELDSAIHQSELGIGRDLTVYRGIPDSVAAQYDSLAPGQPFTEPGFMSTSMDKGVAGNFAESAVVEIHAEEGAHALDMAQPGIHLEHVDEKWGPGEEIVFPRGSELFKSSDSTPGHLVMNIVTS